MARGGSGCAIGRRARPPLLGVSLRGRPWDRDQTKWSPNQLGMRIARRIGAVVGRARLSHEKLHDLLAGQSIKAPDIAALFDFDPYPDRVMRDKRRRQSPVESGIRALT